MRNNIAGGLVIFMVVLTCLLLLDDISYEKESVAENSEIIEQTEAQTDLAIIDSEE